MTTEVAHVPASRATAARIGGGSVATESLSALTTAALVVLLIVGASLLVGPVGADARWLAALGHSIVSHGRVPSGVPFAAAPSEHWHNVTVLGEVIFWGLESAFGDRGLALAQGLAVGAAFWVLAVDARRAGARDDAIASTCLIAAVGAASSLAVTRAQLFSLPLFPLLLSLLRSDARVRSRRIAWIVPLFALWGNLHGAVLVGLLVALVYLAVDRVRDRPAETMVLGVACVAALCVNPAGVHAFAYYAGVAHNMAAQRGEGMWGMLTPLSISGALVVAASVALVLRSSRRRPRGWEVVVALLLTAMTVHAARSSVWLLFALVAPAAAGARAGAPWRMRRVLAAGVALASLAVAIGRGPAPSGASAPLVHEAIERAAGSPILASDIGAEQIALAGGRVWLSDPIDAFRRGAQAAYLDFLDGRQSGLRAAGEAVKSVLVERGSPEARLMDESPEFVLAGHDGTYLLFTRRSAAPNL